MYFSTAFLQDTTSWINLTPKKITQITANDTYNIGDYLLLNNTKLLKPELVFKRTEEEINEYFKN